MSPAEVMMPAMVNQAFVVYRVWDEDGMHEEEFMFTTVAELFEFCLKSSDDPEQNRIHRVVVKDSGLHGETRQLTLGFQSIIGHD